MLPPPGEKVFNELVDVPKELDKLEEQEELDDDKLDPSIACGDRKNGIDDDSNVSFATFSSNIF